MHGKAALKALAVTAFLCALPAAFLLFCPAARADDGEVGAGGGTVYPVKTADIRMAAETVQAVCFGGFAEYRVDFLFVNEGKPRQVKLGFPFTAVLRGEQESERPVGFQAWQGSRPLTVTAVEMQASSGGTYGLFLHEARFPHGSTMITVSYLAQASAMPVGQRRKTDPQDGPLKWAAWYQYWLHTGSTWKGTIGKAIVRYRLADSFRGSDLALRAKDAAKDVLVTAPSNWSTPLPRTYQWVFSNFDPKPVHATDWWEQASPYDITLGFQDATGNSPTQGAWTQSSAADGFGVKGDGGGGRGSLSDGECRSFWAEGVPGPGIGQWVQTRLKHSVRLRELRILPGNNSYATAFRRYGRPKTLKAIFSDGRSRLLHLADAPTLQRFPVNVTTRSVRFVIMAAYRGTDYPATCISEVELGTQRAPGFAPFRRLIEDRFATGHLSAWAGAAAPAPVIGPATQDQEAQMDAQSNGNGDLIGVTVGHWPAEIDSPLPRLPSDEAPFKEPAALAAVTAANPDARLPAQGLVGAPTKVTALSHWVFEIDYSSGVDVLVNTRLPATSRVSLTSERAAETQSMADNEETFTDGRKHPFDLVNIGGQAAGLAGPGSVAATEYHRAEAVPGQLFWQQGHVSYHLYARSKAVTTGQLVVAARSMLGVGAESGQKPAPTSSWSWWLGLAVGLFVVAATGGFVVWRRARRSTPPPDSARG